MPPACGAALATTHRVVDRVHGGAAVVRTLAHPAAATGLAEGHARMKRVADLPNGGAAVEVNHPYLVGGQPNLRVIAVLGHLE